MKNKQYEGAYAPAFVESRKRLGALNPQEIIQKSLCRYDEAKSCLYLKSFNQAFLISYPAGEILNTSVSPKPPLDWALILLNYLSGAKDLPLTGDLVTYRDLPMGNVFFPSIKTYVLEVLGKFYEECNKNSLENAFQRLGFVLLNTKADLTVRGYFTPRIPIQIQFWEGEEDIPSTCQILFDSSIADQLHIEDIAALCGTTRDLILYNYEKEK
jgi:hypothetical protein